MQVEIAVKVGLVVEVEIVVLATILEDHGEEVLNGQLPAPFI